MHGLTPGCEYGYTRYLYGKTRGVGGLMKGRRVSPGALLVNRRAVNWPRVGGNQELFWVAAYYLRGVKEPRVRTQRELSSGR